MLQFTFQCHKRIQRVENKEKGPGKILALGADRLSLELLPAQAALPPPLARWFFRSGIGKLGGCLVGRDNDPFQARFAHGRLVPWPAALGFSGVRRWGLGRGCGRWRRHGARRFMVNMAGPVL